MSSHQHGSGASLPNTAITSVAGRKRKREADDIQKFEITNLFGKSVKEASRKLGGVTMKEFIKRANEVEIYEWSGVDGMCQKITNHISYMKEEILVRLLLEEKNESDENDTMIPIFVPTTFTFDQFKIMAREKYQSINVPFQLAIDSGLSWKVDDKWALLTNSQAWHFLVKTWFNNRREFIDIKLSPKNKLDTHMKELFDIVEVPGDETVHAPEAMGATPSVSSAQAMDKGKSVME